MARCPSCTRTGRAVRRARVPTAAAQTRGVTRSPLPRASCRLVRRAVAQPVRDLCRPGLPGGGGRRRGRRLLALVQRVGGGRRLPLRGRDAGAGDAATRRADGHDAAAAALCPRLPPVPVELQGRGGRERGPREVRRAQPALRRALARHRAHRPQALLHVERGLLPDAAAHAAGARAHRAQDGDDHRPAPARGGRLRRVRRRQGAVAARAHGGQLVALRGRLLAGPLGVGRLPAASGACVLGVALPARRVRGLLRDAVHVERHERAVRLRRARDHDAAHAAAPRRARPLLRAPRAAQHVRPRARAPPPTDFNDSLGRSPGARSAPPPTPSPPPPTTRAGTAC
jgi:hypothetical protein